MWIKDKNMRHNLNNVKRYSYDLNNPKSKLGYLKFPDETCNLTFYKITGAMFCDYLDNLIKTGEDKNIPILEINNELEETILAFNLQFPTMEEFKK